MILTGLSKRIFDRLAISPATIDQLVSACYSMYDPPLWADTCIRVTIKKMRSKGVEIRTHGGGGKGNKAIYELVS